MSLELCSRLLVCGIAMVVLAGCLAAETPARVRPDFAGVLVDVDDSGWTESPGGGGTGGPNSSHRVGPGTMTLADGTEVIVAGDTPGGNTCRLLGGEPLNGAGCLIVGEFTADGRTAAWFATLGFDPLDDPTAYRMAVDRFDGRDAILWGTDEFVVVASVRADARLIECADEGDLASNPLALPDAAGFVAHLDSDGVVTALECLYGD